MKHKPKALRVYERLFPSDIIFDDDPRRPEIIQEMLIVCRSKTIENALKGVSYWGWGSEEEMIQTVKKLRKVWKQL